ncbi:unknown [Clostridium sp. CAG:967]|nr:unknown [Clostridium sp. CAG:967]
MPVLVTKYRNLVYVARLKKSYTTIENGFQKMLADDGVQYLSDTTAFNSITKDTYYGGSFAGSSDNNLCPVFTSYLKKYFRIIDIKTDAEAPFSSLNKSARYKSSVLTMFEDGSMLRSLRLYKSSNRDYEICKEIAKLGGKLCTSQGDLIIDVNGIAPPNLIGRDIFSFIISDDGHLFPENGLEYAYYYARIKYNSTYWQKYYWNYPLSGGCTDNKSDGDGCAARIMEKGWIMDY